MDCQSARERISWSLDGELDEAEAGELRQHVASCEACARCERGYRRLDEALKSQALPQPPEDYEQELLDALRYELTPPVVAHSTRSSRVLLRVAAAAALVIVMGSVALLLVQVRGLQRVVATLRDHARTSLNAESRSKGFGGDSVVLANGEVGEQVQAFRAVQDDLGGQLRWMAQDGAQVEIGLSNASRVAVVPEAKGSAMVFAFRLVRVEADGSRTHLSAPYLTVCPGAEARVWLKPSDRRGPSRFLYQVSGERRADGRVTARIAFSWSTTPATGQPDEIIWMVRTRLVLRGKTPVMLGQYLRQGRRYELWGTVIRRRLAAGVGGDAT